MLATHGRCNRPIRKAVIPVAGLGTRFLPATKAIPKEMLPVVDRPVIQYVVDEARAAGIEHFMLVTGRNKGVIEDHFDIQVELEKTLKSRGRTEALAELASDLPTPGQMSFTRQQAPLGLGHAVWCAREMIGNEPFAVLLADMVMRGEPGCLAQMVATYNEVGGNVVAVEECDPADTGRYGIVGVGEASARTPSASPDGREAEAGGGAVEPLSSTAATSFSRASSPTSPARSAAPATKSS